MKGDSDLLCTAGDAIDNAVFAAILSLCTPESRPEWDMSLIGVATDAVTDVMEKHGLKVCHPFEDCNEVICHKSEDRCSYCNRS